MKFPSAATRSNIFLTAIFMLAVTPILGACWGSVNIPTIQKTAVDVVIESHEDDPTYWNAFVGYGETCTLETWTYPAKYEGIQDWKDKDPENAKPSITKARPNDKGCERNFNPKNPAEPLTSRDYGNNYGNRFKDIYSPRPA
jgi:hypothetical protein